MSFNVRYKGKWIDAMAPAKPKIYGVKIEIANSHPNDAVTYIDDAEGFTPMTRNSPGSWAGNPLISGIKPVCRKTDGTWVDLDKRNLARDTSGNPVAIETVGNDVFTRFPTWWLSITTDGTFDYVRFSDQQVDDTYMDLASFFMGERKGMFHMGCWHAYNSGNQTYSSANKSPSVGFSTEQFRVYSQARGAGFDQVGYYHIIYLQALFLVLFKGRHGQELLGKGYTSGSSVTTENRTTYNNDYGMAGSSSGTDQMAFFWINNFWGNIYDFLGGAKTDGNSKLMTQIDGNLISPTNSDAGYRKHNTIVSNSAGWIKQTECTSTEVGFFPKQWGGNENQNWCDFANIIPSKFPGFGGRYEDQGVAGPFYMRFDRAYSDIHTYFGSRLVYREAVD